MKLEEVLQGCELKNDRATGSLWGPALQLEIIGWKSYERKSKYYVLKCNICAQDPDLFGDGVFLSPMGSLKAGSIPCGCAPNVKWTEQQYSLLCEREADRRGYEFLGWSGKYNRAKTKLRLVCNRHGEWVDCRVSNFIIQGNGCPSCGDERTIASRKLTDEQLIERFFSTGSFHEKTLFTRSSRLTRAGKAEYWDVYCPVCDTENSAMEYGLQIGFRPCKCPRHRQTLTYIHTIFNHDCDTPIALKFGMTHNVDFRLTRLRRSTEYTIEKYGTWEFSSTESCRAAEAACVNEILPCNILTKDEFGDGYTETTLPCNLEEIIEIFERFGGQRVDTSQK